MATNIVAPTTNGSDDISYQLLSDTKVFQGANLEGISPLHNLMEVALFTLNFSLISTLSKL